MLTAWIVFVMGVCAAYVGVIVGAVRERTRHWQERDKSRDVTRRFSKTLIEFSELLQPISFIIVLSDTIFVTWQEGDFYIDLNLHTDERQKATVGLRYKQSTQELEIYDDSSVGHVVGVMRRFAEEHKMLKTQQPEQRRTSRSSGFDA